MHIYIDISELHRTRANTGIQRVVKEFLIRLVKNTQQFDYQIIAFNSKKRCFDILPNEDIEAFIKNTIDFKFNTVDTLQIKDLSDTNYILLVGSIEPRKNIKHFLEAYTNLPESLKKHFKVIHVGPSGWLNTEIHNKIQQLESKGQFKALGYLPENELVCLYAGAYVFAFPSIYEGFGLPPLEAMASGVPVLASNISSIPEVVGDCGILTDPFDVDKMSFDLERILTDNQLRSLLMKKGPERAKQFSWDNCVNQTLEVYKQVIAL